MVEANSAAEAISAVLTEQERSDNRPVLGLWDLGVSNVDLENK